MELESCSLFLPPSAPSDAMARFRPITSLSPPSIESNLTFVCLFQSPRNGDDLSEGEGEMGSPEDGNNDVVQKVSEGGRGGCRGGGGNRWRRREEEGPDKGQINLRARLSSNRIGAGGIV